MVHENTYVTPYCSVLKYRWHAPLFLPRAKCPSRGRVPGLSTLTPRYFNHAGYDEVDPLRSLLLLGDGVQQLGHPLLLLLGDGVQQLGHPLEQQDTQHLIWVEPGAKLYQSSVKIYKKGKLCNVFLSFMNNKLQGNKQNFTECEIKI